MPTRARKNAARRIQVIRGAKGRPEDDTKESQGDSSTQIHLPGSHP